MPKRTDSLASYLDRVLGRLVVALGVSVGKRARRWHRGGERHGVVRVAVQQARSCGRLRVVVAFVVIYALGDRGLGVIDVLTIHDQDDVGVGTDLLQQPHRFFVRRVGHVASVDLTQKEDNQFLLSENDNVRFAIAA